MDLILPSLFCHTAKCLVKRLPSPRCVSTLRQPALCFCNLRNPTGSGHSLQNIFILAIRSLCRIACRRRRRIDGSHRCSAYFGVHFVVLLL